MATAVTDTVEVKLIDGTSVTLRSLPVKYLRRVYTKFGEYTKAAQTAVEENDSNFDPDGIILLDNLIECASIALEGLKVEVEEPEEVLDIEVIYKILKVGADIDLKSTANLQREALGLTVQE